MTCRRFTGHQSSAGLRNQQLWSDSWVSVRWIKSQPDPVGNYIIQNRKAAAAPLRLVTVGAVGHSLSFNCQLCCLLSSGRCAADTSFVSGCHFLFKAPIISTLNIITHPVNMRTDWIKHTLLSLGLKNTSVMRCPPSYWLWVGCGTFIQCDRGEPGTLFPGTLVPPHTDTLLWSATLILIKCCLTRAHEDQGCWGWGVVGGADIRINTRLNEGRQWWCRWCGNARGTSCPQALG